MEENVRHAGEKMAGKRGRPSKPRQAENEKNCLEYYEDFKSAGYTAKKLKLNRHTVEEYYQKFAAKEIEETNKEFIANQRATKRRVLSKIDGLIDKAQHQIERCESLLDDENPEITPEAINFEKILQKSITDLNSLYQQRADIEMTPTLDIHIEAEIEKKYGEFNETNAITKQTGKSKSK